MTKIPALNWSCSVPIDRRYGRKSTSVWGGAMIDLAAREEKDNYNQHGPNERARSKLQYRMRTMSKIEHKSAPFTRREYVSTLIRLYRWRKRNFFGEKFERNMRLWKKSVDIFDEKKAVGEDEGKFEREKNPTRTEKPRWGDNRKWFLLLWKVYRVNYTHRKNRHRRKSVIWKDNSVLSRNLPWACVSDVFYSPTLHIPEDESFFSRFSPLKKQPASIGAKRNNWVRVYGHRSEKKQLSVCVRGN